MGLLTDFFVATLEEAARYDEILNREDLEEGEEGEEVEDAPALLRVEHKGLTGIELSGLWALLTDEELSMDRHALIIGPMTEESEAILEQFPPPFVTKIVAMQEDDLPSIARLWARTEGIRHSVEELVPILVDLQTLATSAVRSNKNLYVWYCA